MGSIYERICCCLELYKHMEVRGHDILLSSDYYILVLCFKSTKTRIRLINLSYVRAHRLLCVVRVKLIKGLTFIRDLHFLLCG